MIGAGKGHISAAAFLIQHGAIVDLQDGNGETALHHAVLFSLRKIWIRRGLDMELIISIQATEITAKSL